MDEIENSITRFINRFPTSVSNLDDFIKPLLPPECQELITEERDNQRYYLVQMPLENNGNITYIPTSEATDSQKKYINLFGVKRINYSMLIADGLDKKIDFEKWEDELYTQENQRITQFVFECNYFKGIYFLKKMETEIDSILQNWEDFSGNENVIQKRFIDAMKKVLINIKTDVIGFISNTIKPATNKLSKAANDLIWYKLAELFANGTLELTNKNTYRFEGVEIDSESVVCQKVSSYFKNTIKVNSVKPYLSATRSPKHSNLSRDKNIFKKLRLNNLKAIGMKFEESGQLTDYFKNKLRELGAES